VKVRSELSAREVEELYDSLARRLGDSSVPSLPEVAVRIIELVSDPTSSVTEFARIIKSDQGLTARLLRLANSAAYAQRRHVTTIERATVVIGLDKLKAFALGFHLSRAASIDSGDFSYRRLWSQSLYRAFVAMRLCEQLKSAQTGEAFIIGLMADAGIPLMPKLIGGSFESCIRPADSPAQQFAAEWSQLPFTHVDVIAVLARNWRFPDVLCRPIELHHARVQARPPLAEDALLHAVAFFAGNLQLDRMPDPSQIHEIAPLARDLFGLTNQELLEVFTMASEDFRAARDLFSHIVDSALNIDSILEHAARHCKDYADDPSPDGEEACIRSEGATYIFSKRGPALVEVCIADPSGKAVLSEVIDTDQHSDEYIRAQLMLDRDSPQCAERVLRQIRSMAA